MRIWYIEVSDGDVLLDGLPLAHALDNTNFSIGNGHDVRVNNATIGQFNCRLTMPDTAFDVLVF